MKLHIMLMVIATAISLASCSDRDDYNQTKSKKTGERVSADVYFQQTDFSRYINHSVYELLSDVPFQYISRQGFDEPPGKLRGVSYVFESGYEINITAKQLWYTRRFDEKRQWDLNSISKEKITGIEVRRYGNNPYKKTFGELLR